MCVLSVCVCVCVVSGASAGPQLDGGRLYRFSYRTELSVNRPKGSSRGNVGFKISGDVDISLAWRNPENHDEQLLRVQVRRTKNEGKQQQESNSTSPNVLFLSYHDKFKFNFQFQ